MNFGHNEQAAKIDQACSIQLQRRHGGSSNRTHTLDSHPAVHPLKVGFPTLPTGVK